MERGKKIEDQNAPAEPGGDGGQRVMDLVIAQAPDPENIYESSSIFSLFICCTKIHSPDASLCGRT